MKQFSNIHEAVDAYKRGEATLDDVSRAASRVIVTDLRRRGVRWEIGEELPHPRAAKPSSA